MKVMVGLTQETQNMNACGENDPLCLEISDLDGDAQDGDYRPLILDEGSIENETNEGVSDITSEIKLESSANEDSSLGQIFSSLAESFRSEYSSGYSSEPLTKPEGRKRKNESNSSKSSKKLKLNTESNKNPVSLLNEMFPGLVFSLISSEGPSHDPTFTIGVNVNGIDYVGRGKSKKDAKRMAAESVLSFMTEADACTISYDPSQPVLEPSKPPKKMRIGTVNPISLLLEKRNDCQFDVVDEGTKSHPKCFCVRVKVDGKEFQGSGSSKKKAKAAAAHAALSELYPELLATCTMTVSSSSAYVLNQTVADAIYYQMTKAAEELFGEVNLRYKVLSGIAMGWKDNPVSLETISLTTGTKCVKGDQLNYEGKAVYDCHAEILARRSLLLYLYDQLEKALNKESSILVYNSSTKLYKVNPSVQFHLFINTMPCGDGRAFSPHSADEDNHPNRASRSKLRVKLESGEGTIPIPNSITQTVDGIRGGEPLLTMSCSDKIAKWNVLGLQGSLLSHFLEPVYLKSVVCCQMTHSAHLERALFKRMHGILLPSDQPFHVNEHLLGFPSLQKNRVVQKAINQSINWNCVDGTLEFINTGTGTTMSEMPSRLCKRSLFKHFCKLFGRINRANTETMGLNTMTYRWAKERADKYNECLKRVLTEVTNRRFGHWVKKPAELEHFSLNAEELTLKEENLDSQAVNPSHHLQH